jgi:hypothetical protein
MAKIKITESELKQLIRESVETVMDEATGMQNRRNQRYLDAQNAYNAAQTSWADAPQNVKDEYTERLRNNPNYKFNSPEELYNSDMQTKVTDAKRRLDRATRRNGLQFQQQLKQKEAALQTMKKELDTYIQKNQDLTNQVKTATDSMAQIANALGIKVPKQQPETTVTLEEAAQTAAGNGLQQILTAIKNLKGQVNQLTKANQNLTTQLAQARGQNVSNNANQKQLAQTTSIPQQTTRPTATPGTTPGTARA